MRVLLITDTHWGVRGDSRVHLAAHVAFHERLLIPAIDRLGIGAVVHLGDVVDRRKFVNFNTAMEMRRAFLEPIAARGIPLHAIVGNHDVSYRNTNSVNALDELVADRYPNTTVHVGPTEIDLDGLRVALIPWVCDENETESMSLVGSTRAPVLMGHLELRGFEAYRGRFQEHGMDPDPFHRFDLVCSGHYHHRSSRGRIHYLGAPYEMTWSDHDDERGFHVLDTETLALEFHRNTDVLHHRVRYDDGVPGFGDRLDRLDHSHLAGKYVKVVVARRTNTYWFDRFMSSIEAVGPADCQVVEDGYSIALEDSSTIDADGPQDTLSIIRGSVESLGIDDPGPLIRLLTELHDEAVAIGADR